MSWSDRRTLLAALGLMPLAACGFTPLYGESTAASELAGRVRLDIAASRMSFFFREQFELRLGKPEAGDYSLAVDLDTVPSSQVIQPDRSILRYTLRGEAAYQLTRGETVILKDTVRSVTAYNATASPFATQAAARDGERRLAIALADQIVTRLAATSGDWLT